MDVKGAVTGEDWMGLKPASVQTFNWSKLRMLSAHLSPCRETIWTRASNRFSTIAEYHVIINTHQENDCVLRSSSECQFGTLSCYFYAILAQVGLTSQSRLMYPFNADCSWRRYSCWHVVIIPVLRWRIAYIADADGSTLITYAGLQRIAIGYSYFHYVLQPAR